MADWGKVINGLEHHSRCQCSFGKDDICPYWSEENDSASLCRDALELLKAQEPVKPKKINRYMDFDEDRGWFLPDVYDCGWCGEELPWMLDTAKRQTKHYKPNYCPDCGRKVRWE